MPSSPNSPPRPLPGWLQVVGSVLAVGHLLVIGVYALAANSGPWPYQTGSSSSPGPQFATTISMGVSYPYYLEPLRMTHNYHFMSNRPTEIAVYFEVILKNAQGEAVQKLKFPDEKANAWVRHRHEILAQNLVPDHPMPPRGNKRIPAPGKELPKVEIWMREDAQTLRLAQVDELDVPNNQQVDQPSEWSKVVVRSYLRHLCRVHKADSAELIRHSRPTVMPMDLFVPRPADIFNELKSNFGETRRE